MMTSNKRCRLDEEALETTKGAPHFLDILHVVLKNIQPEDLPQAAKHNLRVTCKAAKANVDAYLEKVHISHPDSILGDRKHVKTLRGSSLPLAATKLYCGDSLSRGHMHKLNPIQFPNLEEAKITIESGGLDRLPLKKWSKLKKLDLSVIWHYDIHPLSTFNTYWKSFSKAKWPLLENLTLEITPDEFSDTDSDDAGMSIEERPNVDVGGSACLLSYFPNLKNLKIKNDVSSEDVKALAAMPHKNLERLELSFNRFQNAEWPAALVNAPWFRTLKKLKFSNSFICLDAGTELVSRLQHAGQSLEELEIENCTTDIFAVFEDVHFPKLKKLSIALERTHEAVPGTEHHEFNSGLATFFNTAKFPCLESLNISQREYHFSRAECRTRSAYLSWDVAPTSATMQEENRTARVTQMTQMMRMLEREIKTEDQIPIFPSLKNLSISDIQIGQHCTKYLAETFFKRDTCEIDLGRARVDSGLDDERLDDILKFYRLSHFEFNHELSTLGLLNQVYWYNLLSMEELKTIAASLFLFNLAEDLESVLEPAKNSMAMVVEKAAPSQGKDELLEKRYQATRDALQKLNNIIPKTNFCGQHCASVGVASGSGGGGSGRCGRKKRPPSPAAVI